jgi:GH24 family phage-related lysozyme (muramidase)/peptidoglycan hydrolase-like protein with peptidoglycan-binding domain
MRSSQKALDLIVAEEVTSEAVYTAKYQHPEWPGLQSGVTIGIGYDCGYATASRIAQDWGPHLPASAVALLQTTSGKVGAAAHAALAGVRSVTVPWSAAMAVFEERDMPKWEAGVLKAIPSAAELPPDCFGVITSVAYNRGVSFTKAGDRYKEMRDIRTHITNGDWASVPDDLRSMKRLWDGSTGKRTSGLVNRREHEAALFEEGLEGAPIPEAVVSSNRVDTGDDRADPTEVTSEGTPPLNVQTVRVKYKLEDEILQTKLLGMGYREIGKADGKWGGRTRGAVTAFMNDRGKSPDGLADERGFTSAAARSEVMAEVSAAVDAKWTRPIAPERANATAKDIAPKVASVNQTWYQKLWAVVLGVPAAAGAAFKQLFGDYNDPASTIYSIKSFFAQIPTEYYLLAAAGIGAFIFIQAKRAQDATVKAYQRGEIN